MLVYLVVNLAHPTLGAGLSARARAEIFVDWRPRRGCVESKEVDEEGRSADAMTAAATTAMERL